MGGGKEKTYSDIHSSQIYDQGDNLYTAELIRMFASMGGIFPAAYTKSMIDASTKYFNVNYLEKLGVTCRVNVPIKTIMNENVIEGVSDRLGFKPAFTAILVCVMNDIDGNAFTMRAERLKAYFENEFEVDTSVTVSFTETHEVQIKDETFSAPICTGTCPSGASVDFYGTDLHTAILGTNQAVITISTDTNLYHETDALLGYTFADPIQMNGLTEVLMDEYEKVEDDEGNVSWEPTDNQIWKTVPEDTRTLFFVRAAYRDDTECTVCQADDTPVVNPDGWSVYDGAFFRDELRWSPRELSALVLPIKDDFKFASTDKYQRLLMNSYGFKEDDFRDSLSDENIKAALMTYATAIENGQLIETDELLRKYFLYMYTTENGKTEVNINHDLYDIRYGTGKTTCDETGNCDTTYISQIIFDGDVFDIEDGQHLYMMPLEPLLEIPFKDRYDFLKRDMCLFANTEITVKLKWYQTGFFKFVFTIVSIGFALFTGGATAAAWTAASMIVGHLATQLFGEQIGMVVGILFGTLKIAGGSLRIGFDSNRMLDNILDNWFDLAIGSIGKVSQSIVKSEMKSLQKEIETITEETKEAREELEEVADRYLYIPLAQYDDYYDTLYNGYRTLYSEAMYDPYIGIRASTQIGAFG